MNTITIDGLNVKPGDFITTDFGSYEHWSLVSDKVCDSGKWMLISARKKTGTVLEETWDTVINGQPTRVVQMESEYSVDELINRARSKINDWKYSISSMNCEHFSNWVAKNKLTSKQVVYGATTGAAGLTTYLAYSKKPSLAGGLLSLFAGIFVGSQLGKSTKKKDDDINSKEE